MKTIYILLISFSAHGQNLSEGSLIFRPTLELSRFRFVEFGYGGQGTNYGPYKSQMRCELKTGIFYQYKSFNVGLGGSLVGFGEVVRLSGMPWFLPFNSCYFRSGFNISPFIGLKDDLFGPFIDVALIRKRQDNYLVTSSYKVGLEYDRDNLFLAFNYGLFCPTKEEMSKLSKNKTKVYRSIYQLGFEVGYSLTIKGKNIDNQKAQI